MIVIIHFRVTIVTDYRVLTRYMGVSYIPTYE
jgi:hypothetical protein